MALKWWSLAFFRTEWNVVEFCVSVPMFSIVVIFGVSAPMFSIPCLTTIRSGVKDTEVSLSGLFKYSVSLTLKANVHGHK